MRNNILLALCCLLLSFSSFSQKRDLEDVKAVLETFRLALISGDRAQLLAHTSPQLSYGHSSGVIENQTEFIEKLASGMSDFVSINTTNETISVHKNTAIVRHDLFAEINDGGNAGTVKLKVLLVWVKSGNMWNLVARQAVKFQ